MDPIFGCPSVALPEDHLARKVEAAVAQLDLSSLEEKYSSLGRHGYHPRNVLAVWMYASQTGVHHSTKVAGLLKTDLAYRYLSGGHAISAGKLRRFRREGGKCFAELIQQTVDIAQADGLLPTEELSIDSVRLRAHASLGATRTLERSKLRSEQLAAVEVNKLESAERLVHDARVEKHRHAIEICEATGRTNCILTNPSAALMKFPNGAAMPGHRVTVTAAGVKLRLIVSLLIDAAGNDFGKLGPAVVQAQAALQKAGVPKDQLLRFAADAGYTSEEDLLFTLAQKETVEILLADAPLRGHRNTTNGEKFFTRGDFDVAPDGKATCPASRQMKGPMADGQGRRRYEGVGCGDCPLHDRCTDRKIRSLTIRPRFEEARQKIVDRMANPDARKNYRKRVATVEPVFSGLEDAMGFRRISTRATEAAKAEILLKVLAYNLSRLAAARLRRALIFMVTLFGDEAPIVVVAGCISANPLSVGRRP